MAPGVRQREHSGVMELDQPGEDLRHAELERFGDVQMDAVNQSLFAPTQQGIQNAFVGGIGSYIQMAYTSCMLDEIYNERESREALLRFDEEGFTGSWQSATEFLQVVELEGQHLLEPA